MASKLLLLAAAALAVVIGLSLPTPAHDPNGASRLATLEAGRR